MPSLSSRSTVQTLSIPPLCTVSTLVFTSPLDSRFLVGGDLVSFIFGSTAPDRRSRSTVSRSPHSTSLVSASSSQGPSGCSPWPSLKWCCCLDYYSHFSLLQNLLSQIHVYNSKITCHRYSNISLKPHTRFSKPQC